MWFFYELKINCVTELTFVCIFQFDNSLSADCDVTNKSFSSIILDCQILILEQLDLSSLLNIAQTNGEFFQLANDVYRHRFGDRALSIRSSDFNAELDDILIAKNFNYIIVTNTEIAVKIIRIFGSIIKSVMLHCSGMKRSDVEEITKAMNDNCTDSLVRLEILDSSDLVWKSFQSPFKHVEALTLESNVQTNEVALNELFPNLSELSLKDVEIFNRSAFRQTFPHLEHLLLVIFEMDGFVDADVIDMIQKNPQLESLSLENASMKLLKFVNEQLPKLKSFEIVTKYKDSSFSGEGEMIKFENVENVSLKFYSDEVPRRIIFPKANKLEMECSSELDDTWIDYLKQSHNLSVLTVNCRISNEQIATLAKGMESLTEIHITCAMDVENQTIIKFIESNPKIKIFQLKTFSKTMANELMLNVGHKYKVTEQSGCIDIERYSKMWTLATENQCHLTSKNLYSKILFFRKWIF